MFGRRSRSPSDFSKELQAHLELEMDRLRAEGRSEEEAYQAARRSLGNLATATERFYESGRWLWPEYLWHETRHALRRLRRAPAFTITATLAAVRFLGSQLYGINQYDPMIIAGAILVLSFSALTAALIPALRASSISPIQALRSE